MKTKAPKIITPESLANGTENGEQMALMQWCALNRPTYPELKWIAAIPNGGWRHPRTAMVLKATGAKAGFPDMILAMPRGRYHGCFVELKLPADKQSVVSALQTEWHEFLAGQGYAVYVAYGWEMARDCFIAYIRT